MPNIPQFLTCHLCGTRCLDVRNLVQHMQTYHFESVHFFNRGAPREPSSWPYELPPLRGMTHTQYRQSSSGFTLDVILVTSSRFTAVATITSHDTSPITTTTVSQASGTVTDLDPGDLVRDPGNECPICFDSLDKGETSLTPCCNTKFHSECLRKLSISVVGDVFPCPNCRKIHTREWAHSL